MKINEFQKNGLIASAILAVIIVFLLNCCAGTAGSFQIDQTSYRERSSTSEIIQFPNGTEVPEGFEYLTTAEFKTGAITIKCDYDFMLQEAKRATIQAGGDAFRLSNVKKPDYFMTTCYSATIIIFRKRG